MPKTFPTARRTLELVWTAQSSRIHLPVADTDISTREGCLFISMSSERDELLA